MYRNLLIIKSYSFIKSFEICQIKGYSTSKMNMDFS